jgi:4-hydroxybenzoate polyprenyltransferase
MAVPMAYSASNSEFDVAGIAVFVATIFWAVAFDTLYAIVDRDDDQKIGVKSTARLFGRYIHQAVISCQVIVLSLFLLVAMVKHLPSPFYIFWFGAVGSIFYQVILMQQRCEHKYFQAFLQNHWTGLLLFAAIFSSYLGGSH